MTTPDPDSARQRLTLFGRSRQGARRRGRLPWRLLPFAFFGFVVVGGDGVSTVLPLLGFAGAAVAMVWWSRRSAEPDREEAPQRAEPHPSYAADPLVGRALALAARLAAVGHPEAARRVRAGAEDLGALRSFLRTLGDVGVREDEARREQAELEARAAATADPEARKAWRQGAVSAARRLDSLAALRVEWERASARVAAFEQRIKTLEVDLTRLGERPGILALEDHLALLNDELAGIARAREEVRRLEGMGG